MRSKLEGYLAIPHELLHVAGYRLVGKQCLYRWGESYVTPIGPMTRRERLVGLLFPFVVSFIVFLLLTILSGLLSIYYRGQGDMPLWVLGLGILSPIIGAYSICASFYDLRKAYLLILNKPLNSSTPFDLLLKWPQEMRSVEVRIFALTLALLTSGLLLYLILVRT